MGRRSRRRGRRYPAPASVRPVEPVGTPTIQLATNGAIIGDQAAYARTIEGEIASGSRSINAVGVQYANNTAPTRAGFVAEQDHAATFNVDAAIKRSDLRAHRPASNAAQSPDLIVTTSDGLDVTEASSKVYADPRRAAEAQRGYGSQQRIVPSDQLTEARAHSRRQVAKNQATGGTRREGVAADFREVEAKLTDRLRANDVESQPRTRQRSAELGQQAREQSVTGKDVVPTIPRAMKDSAVAGAKKGGATGAVISLASATYENARDYRAGRKSGGHAVADVAVETLKGTADGAAKGAIASAVTAGTQVAAQHVQSNVLRGLLRGNAPAAMAITGVEVAKHAIRLANGTIEVEQFKTAAMQSAKVGAYAYAGAALGGIFGPAGMVIGGVAGPALMERVNRLDVITRLERVFAHNTAWGHEGAFSHHLGARAVALQLLDADASSVAFLDRVVPGRHAPLAAEAVVWSHGTLFAVDFAAWKGELVRVTGAGGKHTIVQRKYDQWGNEFIKECRDPLRRLHAFAISMKRWLAARSPRWNRVSVHPVVAFCGDDVTFGPGFRGEPGYCRLQHLLEYFEHHGEPSGPSAPPFWLLDDLATTPTWDMLSDRQGNIYQGLIATPALSLELRGDQRLEVPYSAMLKLELKAGGFLSRADEVAVYLRNGDLLQGRCRDSIRTRRMGYDRSFRLRDLSEIVPCSSYFSNQLLPR